MIVISRTDVEQALDGREREVIALVADAYRRHDQGVNRLPHSVFLRFPDNDRDRIIALPGYLGGARPVAGVKWISSFPDNVERGLPRASACIVLNDLTDGTPAALVEGSLISARRTAASAALAAAQLYAGEPPTRLGLIGVGVINREVLRFVLAGFPTITEVIAFDTRPDAVTGFAAEWADVVHTRHVDDPRAVLAQTSLVSIATTASRPWLRLDACRPAAVVLHLSLRDVEPASVLDCRNVVDDVDHVCRERTSVELAARLANGTGFIDTTIGRVLRAGTKPDGANRVTLFSPFGLGVLDLAVAGYVLERARDDGFGQHIPDFSSTTRGAPAAQTV